EKFLNISVTGTDILYYRYKVGDLTLNCANNSGYSTPRSVSLPITDDLGADGHKKICVLGIDSYGSQQTFISATTLIWIKEEILPDVAFLTPAEYSYINIDNQSSFLITGSCAIDGAANVRLEAGSLMTNVDCTSGAWYANLNFLSLPDGPITVKAIQTSSFSGAGSEKTRVFNKLTVPPTLVFLSPAENFYININNSSNFVVSGSCSAAGANVIISGADSNVTAVCDGTNWNATLTFSGSFEQTKVITATMSDVAGNEIVTNRSFILDTV